MLGYEHTLCTNGKELLDKYCEPNSIIDGCIMDMTMPVMDGMESARRIREFEATNSTNGRSKRVPIIALSGNALIEQVMDALSAGISDYLIKPCKQSEISRMLKYWENIVHNGLEHNPMTHQRAKSIVAD
jgi:CheY-like chemotaxis protein